MKQNVLLSHFVMIFISCLIVFSLFAVLFDKLNPFLLGLLLSLVVLILVILFSLFKKEKELPGFKG